MKKKNAYIYRLNYTKIRLTMLCLSGFELYSCWVPLNFFPAPSNSPWNLFESKLCPVF